MIRISKLADYGTVVMAYFARKPDLFHTAKDIAQATHVALPTVSKLLKMLARANLLNSQRGAKGGYLLARTATTISLADIINALDGDVALTECSQGKGICAVEHNCTIRKNWRDISSVIHDVLAKMPLQEMLR